LQGFAQKWQWLEPDAVRTFLKDSELTLTFYQFSPDLRHHIRTTNRLERLFREFPLVPKLELGNPVQKL
jgi:transposase-like protein